MILTHGTIEMCTVTTTPPSSLSPNGRNLPTWLLVLLLLVPLMPSPVAAQTLTVTHIRPESDTDSRNLYFINLLDLALSRINDAYRLVAHDTKMQQGRALTQLQRGAGLDVVWTMTSAERERDLLPIRIPLLKGLIGTRLLLINKEDEQRFRKIETGDELKALKAGQGHDWPDTRILEHHGFQVTASATYEGLFKMLQRRRIDYLPRSIEEIWAEADQHAEEGLIVEESLFIHYPAAIYFFVNRDNHVLAQRLEEGLERALADGSFDSLFTETFDDLLERSNLEERTRIALENPFLTPETPFHQVELWY